jgi:hypothetical protein
MSHNLMALHGLPFKLQQISIRKLQHLKRKVKILYILPNRLYNIGLRLGVTFSYGFQQVLPYVMLLQTKS